MWTKEERGVFKYTLPNGEIRFADPLRVRRELLILTQEKFDDWWNEYINDATPQMTKLTLETKIVGTVRVAFQLKSMEQAEDGIDDESCLGLINDYLAWTEQKKTNLGTTPELSPDSASRPDATRLDTSFGSALSCARVG